LTISDTPDSGDQAQLGGSVPNPNTEVIYSERQRATSVVDQIALCRQAPPRLGCIIPDDLIFTDEELTGAIEQRPDMHG
jgi:hypothetical protein